MFRFVVFLLSVVYFSTTWAQSACYQLFSHPETPTAFSEPTAPFAPADLRKTGMFIEGSSRAGLLEVIQEMSLRDGTYPIIIDSNKNIMITHRLPIPDVGANQPYLGTHRGLYAALYDQLKQRPQILFAGEIRVVGGKVLNMIDQAGTFFDKLENFGSPHNPQTLGLLVAANQQRLEWASGILVDLGIIPSNTQLINFRSRFKTDGTGLVYLNGLHVTARAAAEFERRCRANPACFAQAQFVEKYLRYVSEQGGQAFMIENISAYLQKDASRAGNMVSWLSLLLNEGTYAVMAGADVMVNSKDSKGVLFQKLLVDLPDFLGPLP